MLFSIIITLVKNLFFTALNVVNANMFPKPLSEEEENELLIKTQNGDIEARNKLVEHNLRLVAHIVKKYYSNSPDRDDLISIGTIGLIKGISTFNSEKGIRLATYASRCIENEILMYFRSLKKTSHDVYISDPIDTDKDGNVLTLIDIISDGSDIIDEVDTKIKLSKIYDVAEKNLTKRELQIITARYGLNNKKPLTQHEIAKKLNISRSYVSRIEKAALNKLKNKL